MLFELAMVAAGFVGAEWLHRKVTGRDQATIKVAPTRASVLEKRRILERDREEWVDTIRSPRANYDQKCRATSAVERIDQELLKLADEEATLDE